MADKLDAIALFKTDHRNVEDLFERFEKVKAEQAQKERDAYRL